MASVVSTQATIAFRISITLMFILHFVDWCWAFYGRTQTSSGIVRLNLAMSSTHVLFWIFFSKTFGVAVHSSSSVASDTWAFKLKKLYNFLSCSSLSAVDDNIFKDVGELFSLLLTRKVQDEQVSFFFL